MKTAFVTGGSGYLGRHLIGVLRERGWQVRALARSSPSAAVVEGLDAEPVPGDLDDTAAMAAGMRGAEVVLHCAGLHAGKGDARAMHRVNVLGTRGALAAAQESGVRRFVHVSTESVLAGPAGIRRVDETAPRPRRPLGAYARTKGEAEDLVLSATSPRLETVVVRPRLIWGGEGATVMEGLVKAVSSGAFVWIGGGRYLTSTCHVLNACAGLMAAAEHGRSGEVYFVTDGEPVEFRWLVTELLASQGIEAPTREVPHWLAGLAARGLELAWGVLRRPGEPPLTRELICIVGQECTVRDDKARREIGYQPVVTTEEGLRHLRRTAGARSSVRA